MKKLINSPGEVVRETLEGLVLGNRDLALLPDVNVVVRADIGAHRESGNVSLVSGGGSGHEPAHAGYVGPGMLTAAVAGEVFTSPSVDIVLAAIRAVTTRAGTLLIVKNYTGDRLNFGLAAEIARSEGLHVEMMLVDDDVSREEETSRAGRRGLAGTVLVHKVAGAAAAAGLSLAQVKREVEEVIATLGTMGVALGSCTPPASGSPSFDLGPNEIEWGLGIHGERGVRRTNIQPVDELVAQVIGRVRAAKGINAGDRVALLVNNLGGSSQMELAIVARAALELLHEQGVIVERAMTGAFLTAIEMPGFSISLLRTNNLVLDRLDAATGAVAWIAPTHPQTDCAVVEIPRLAIVADEHVAIVGSGTVWEDRPARLRDVIAMIARALIESESELTKLDAAVGDGDLGVSLTRGAHAVMSVLARSDPHHPGSLLSRIAEALRRSVGGTSGPLYSGCIARMSAHLSQVDWPSPGQWAAAFEAGCAAISDLGGARPGERTMLDAMAPAAEALSVGTQTGRPAYEVLTLALRAARQGCEATKSMTPLHGRSSYLGERALGSPDPGAYAVTVCLQALQQALAGVHPQSPRENISVS